MISPQHRHSALIRTSSLFDEPQISSNDSNSFPLPSPPLPSPPPPDLLINPSQSTMEHSNVMSTVENRSHSNTNFRNIVRFHENRVDRANQEQFSYKHNSLQNHNPARGVNTRPQSIIRPCPSIRIPGDSEEAASDTNRPPSPPLKYSPNEDGFRSSYLNRQPSIVIPKKEPAQDSSPTSSDVDAAISKAESRKKLPEIRSVSSQRVRRPSGGRLLNVQDPPSPLTYSPSVVKYCVSSNLQEDEMEDFKKNRKEVQKTPQIRDPPEILATRGVTPFRRLPRFSTSSSSPSVSPLIPGLDGSASMKEEHNGKEEPMGQRGKWVFPTRRSIYAEESQQAQYELRSSLRKKDTSGFADEEKKPPHHYTGPWMFKGLSPRLPTPLERQRKFFQTALPENRPAG